MILKKKRNSAQNFHAQSSISDLMSGLVFIFIIIIITFAIQLARINEKRSQALDEHKEVSDALDILLITLKKSFEDKNTHVEIDLKNKILHLPTDVLFESGKYTLTATKGVPIVEYLGWFLNKHLNCSIQSQNKICDGDRLKLETIFIEGHSDSVPLGSELEMRIKSNLNLSVQRAIHINDIMKDYIQNLKNHRGEYLFNVVGYGKERPLTRKPSNFDNLTFKEQENKYHKKDRRIDLRFLVAIPKVLRGSSIDLDGNNKKGL